ncbi:hypothetical protein H6504_00255 [Candidatus Woesearchaeota archaeon]|nr:hypothetical protein [Candidatus Woesearchaeota archaeon]
MDKKEDTMTLHTSYIKYKGVFDYDRFFAVIYNWFVHQSFEVYETKYKFKVPSPTGAENEVNWNTERKIDNYFKYQIKMQFKITQLKDVEVVRKDTTQKMSSGRVFVAITPIMITDYSNKFNTPFLNSLNRFFKKFIYKQEIDNVYSDQLYYRAYKLHALIKEHLNMETKENVFDGRW